MKSLALVFLVLFAVEMTSAQQAVPVVRAHSTYVDISDAGVLRKHAWTISPEVSPDTYATSSKGKVVKFYTDIDSISVSVGLKTDFSFIILLNDTTRALTRVIYKPGYLEKLRGGSKYNLSEPRKVPHFTYQDCNDPNLMALKTEFKLDSIAGSGNDISKVLNLLHWIHNLIPHDGNHENPTVRNAMSMIKQCQQQGRGLNCRGLATVLNECYLALGFRSRFVTCMPKDSVFDDCHVINSVYIPSEAKSIWIDPTNNAYVMNEKGQLLSIQEVRDRLIANKPLLLNPDANWNNRISQTKDAYLYEYMAKNLYRLQCPLASEFDSETWKEGKSVTFVQLLPLDAYLQQPKSPHFIDKKTGTTFTYINTNNPVSFWQD